MKVQYFYDGQIRNSLMHIIRMFSEFQVQTGVDDNGKPKLRKVPCRYMDMSRQALSILNGSSENTANYAPMITISIQSLKMDRENVRSPVHQDTIVGTNVTPAVNEYSPVLDKQYHVKRFNPVPWELMFDVNIWTTTMVNKMELWEQIATLFAPYSILKTSMNPLDWTAEEVVELISANFTSRSMPSGTESELDIATLSFKTTVWLSLPGIVQKANIIEQINTNISLGRNEMDIELGPVQDISADVFTPNNLQIRVSKSTGTRYKAELLSFAGLKTGPGGGELSWKVYLDYLRPGWEENSSYLKLFSVLEDANPVRGTIMELPEDEPGVLYFDIQTSSYNVQFSVDDFVVDSKLVRPGDGKTYINTVEMTVQNVVVPPNSVFESTLNGVNITPQSEYKGVAYVSSQGMYYAYEPSIGWYESVLKNYKPGLWKIALVQ